MGSATEGRDVRTRQPGKEGMDGKRGIEKGPATVGCDRKRPSYRSRRPGTEDFELAVPPLPIMGTRAGVEMQQGEHRAFSGAPV